MTDPVHDGGEAYEELGALYDVWCAEVAEDIPFYSSLATALAAELDRASLDIIELGAGSGRITAPLAAAGHRVTALDASPAQLARLRERVAELSPDADVQAMLGDMRELATLLPAASADLVLVPFRGMLHVTPQRAAVLAGVHHALRTGGVLAFDVFHPSGEQVAATHGQWLHRRDAPTSTGRWRFRERAQYRPELAAEPGGLKLEVDVQCRWTGARRRQGTDPQQGEATERATLLELQLVPAERWAAALADAVFALDGSYGWFDGRPLRTDDDDSIWVARRA